MEDIRQYILSVVAAAILCGILRVLLPPSGTNGVMLKLVCGTVLALTVFAPLKDIQTWDISAGLQTLHYDGTAYAASGEELSANALADIITERTQAYILDKAAGLSVSLAVEVRLNQDPMPVPESVCLTGAVSPYARSILSDMLERDLGIAKENQEWIS